jgi:hypothetical protein
LGRGWAKMRAVWGRSWWRHEDLKPTEPKTVL